MRFFIAFWKKDFINKLIVMIILLLFLGVGGVIFTLINMPEDSLFYAYFDFSTKTPVAAKPSIEMTATVQATPDIQALSPFPSITALPITLTPTASPELVEPTLSLLTPSLTAESPFPDATSLTKVDEVDSTSCIPNTPPTTARVVEILDGNTIRAYFDGKVFVVRYIGISAPEVNDVFFRAAFWKNSELVYAKDVTLISGTQETDDKGRLLRYVLVNGTFVNFEMIRQGLASLAETPTDLACVEIFQIAEGQAITEKMGMWALLNTSIP